MEPERLVAEARPVVAHAPPPGKAHPGLRARRSRSLDQPDAQSRRPTTPSPCSRPGWRRRRSPSRTTPTPSAWPPHAGGPALGADGAAEGRRSRRRASSSTPTSKAARAASSPPTPSPRCASTGRRCSAACASRARWSAVPAEEADAYYASRARGSRHRRLGVAAVAPAGRPLRAGEGGGGVHAEIRPRRDPAPALLVGLPPAAAAHRVLARHALPPA